MHSYRLCAFLIRTNDPVSTFNRPQLRCKAHILSDTSSRALRPSCPSLLNTCKCPTTTYIPSFPLPEVAHTHPVSGSHASHPPLLSYCRTHLLPPRRAFLTILALPTYRLFNLLHKASLSLNSTLIPILCLVSIRMCRATHLRAILCPTHLAMAQSLAPPLHMAPSLLTVTPRCRLLDTTVLWLYGASTHVISPIILHSWLV